MTQKPTSRGEAPERTSDRQAAEALRAAELEASLGDAQARLAEAERKRDEYLADLRRLAADFDNYRKRVAREQESLVTRAHEKLVRELLPILDDLERALVAASEHEEAKLEEGVRLVHRALQKTLAGEGLEEIPTEGVFDPHVHEALLAQPSDAEEGSVIDVIQKGYRLGDRVLRPARVVVAGPPAAEPPVRDGGPGEGDGANREVPPAE